MRGKVRRIGAAVLVLIAVGSGVIMPAPAYAVEPVPDEHHYVVNFEQDVAAYINFCVRSVNKLGQSSYCTGYLSESKTRSHTIYYTSGDQILLDITVQWGPSHKDYDITGGTGCSADYEPRCTQCTATGTVQSVKVNCNLSKVQAPPPSMPVVAPYADASGGVLNLLNLLAWCVSACSVLGIIMVGASMAFQLRRGDPGEMSEYMRGLATVIGGCLLGLSAGPLVQFLVPFI